MTDTLRYFKVGDSTPDYYRVAYSPSQVWFWERDRWRNSVLPNLRAFLDDAHGSGATVREVLPSDLPAEVPA